ncbi:MAG: ExeM/NucH family extracellular endonuclease [Burkholderiales bacterium]|nr:ExeM/NucH family extracellular endonuclease [Burkholderiales bacterium]
MKHALTWRPFVRALPLALTLCATHLAAQAADTPIYTIQSSGVTSPLVGQTVTTTGVVTKVHSNGFFLQDPTGDGDVATSDGILIYTGSAPGVTVGQFVRLTGKVVEFNTGSSSNADTKAHTVTELTTITNLAVLGGGYGVAPTVVALPETVNDDLERFEGMLVTLPGPLTVSQNYFQARYGQLTLSAGGRMETPTNRFRPGAQATGLAAENARRRIVLDDGATAQNVNPTPYTGANGLPRAGDTVGDVTGVIDYGLATASSAGAGDYKIHPVTAPILTSANPRTALPEAVGGNVRVASFNVLNYFTTFTNGNTASGQTGQGCSLGTTVSPSHCRGANSLAEFQRQQAKIVEALAVVNGDAVGLMEIQNNGAVAAQNLVDALNAKVGAGTYAAVPDPAAGTGSDAIKVAMIYKPGKLTPLGAAQTDTDAVFSRPPLAQTFSAPNGERLTVVVNHLKSKGSCPASGLDSDQGDGQGCWNDTRVQQTRKLRPFITQLQNASASNDVLLVGDFNAYAMEDPIFELTSNGLTDEIGRFNPMGYSYVFDGAAGRLDHAFCTLSLSGKVSRAVHWHINADEQLAHDYNLEFKQPACATCAPDPFAVSAYRSSDHDPVVLGLNLYKTVRGTTGRDTLLGSAGDDTITGGTGGDVLTGGAGADVFVYESLRDAGDTVTDFVPGKDRIQLSTLLASLGINPTVAFGSGVVKLQASGIDTLLQIDTDGSSGPAAARTLVTLRNVLPSMIQPARDLGIQ